MLCCYVLLQCCLHPSVLCFDGRKASEPSFALHSHLFISRDVTAGYSRFRGEARHLIGADELSCILFFQAIFLWYPKLPVGWPAQFICGSSWHFSSPLSLVLSFCHSLSGHLGTGQCLYIIYLAMTREKPRDTVRKASHTSVDCTCPMQWES